MNEEAKHTGLPYDFADDKALVHFEGIGDMGAKVCTFYQMLRAVEDKGIVKYSVANLEVTRDAAGGGGSDKFCISRKTKKMYKFAETTTKEGDKLFWREIKTDKLPTEELVPVVRFRFEKVGRNFKPMKVYLATKKAVTLKAGMPRKMV